MSRATVIDGNGGPPIADAVVLLSGARILAIGPRRSLSIPAGATEIDARGRWIVPGFLHTNVDLMDDFIAQDGGEEFSIVGSCSM